MSDSVLSQRRGAVLQIKLNRPEVFNSLNEDTGVALVEALQAASDPTVRAVVLTAEGKAFCAGEDLRALRADYESGAAPDLGEILRRRYIPAIETILSMEKPVIASVNGVAAGAGVSLALACDYRIMSESASFVVGFSKVGLVPDAGGTWLLPKYLGVGRAFELAISAEPVSALRAHELGLVNEVVSATDLESATVDKSEELAAGPTVAFALTKMLIWRATGGYLSKHLEEEAKAQATAGKTHDHLEGVSAFLEKRSPAFKGR